ncbi:ATP-binding cassette domain-containing protein, partial [Wenyingzhuangia sp. 1_MG-2023]|nr:ATP-binding cassette domain-containing protein [Wenyingzhuangia sp. 1_MG-2023]
KLHRLALEIENLGHAYDGEQPLFSKTDFMIEAGEKIAVIGANGVGKTTFLKCLVNDITPTQGEVRWSENANVGYYAQDHEYEFEGNENLFD